ncbi:MAG: dephospho-CoA kinase [Bacteroidetes bacterium]|nr:dephospho-CoA kinase [Bacteroidota bacterium]
MLKVGITGGIGSGKSTACKIFMELGIPVYNADERAKHLMQHEHYLIDEIKRNFGDDIYVDGKLVRELLANRVFNNEKKMALLNSLVHPAVFRDTERWIEEQKKTKSPYVLKEAALLIESGSYKNLDKLVVVTAPLELRIKRVEKRDSVTRSQVMKRVQHQMPEEEKLKLADYIIQNDNGLEQLKEQVLLIHHKLLKN